MYNVMYVHLYMYDVYTYYVYMCMQWCMTCISIHIKYNSGEIQCSSQCGIVVWDYSMVLGPEEDKSQIESEPFQKRLS